MATLLLSQGLPMMLGGDEVGHTQGGNNNAYCQDNETTWLAWDRATMEGELVRFVRALTHLRRKHPSLRRTQFFDGLQFSWRGVKDITWLLPDGREMTEQEWGISHARALGLMLGGDPGDKFVSLLGYPEIDDGFLLLMNAHYEAVQFTLPMPGGVPYWRLEIDTDWPNPGTAGTLVPAGATFSVAPRSLVVLAWEATEAAAAPGA